MLERVNANVRYLNPEWRGRAEVPRIWSKETRRAYTSFHTVEVTSARPLAERGELDLDRHGFALIPHSSRVRNFRDDAEVKRVYYPGDRGPDPASDAANPRRVLSPLGAH